MRKILRDQYDHLRRIGKIKNQEQMGRLLGIGQQSAGKLLGTGGTGFSRPTAVKLAELCGFDSPETLLRESGHVERAAPEGWQVRELAMTLARRADFDDETLERVRIRYAESRYASMSTRWWTERIVHEQSQRDAEAQAPEAPKSTPAPAPKAPVRRRRSA